MRVAGFAERDVLVRWGARASARRLRHPGLGHWCWNQDRTARTRRLSPVAGSRPSLVKMALDVDLGSLSTKVQAGGDGRAAGRLRGSVLIPVNTLQAPRETIMEAIERHRLGANEPPVISD